MLFLVNVLWIIELALGVNVVLTVFGVTNLSTVGIFVSAILIIMAEIFKYTSGYYHKKGLFKGECADCTCTEALDCSTNLAINGLFESIDCSNCDAADCLDIDCG